MLLAPPYVDIQNIQPISEIDGNDQITHGPFTLFSTGIQFNGDPTIEQWIDCGKFIKKAKGAVHFWIGDWLNYGESHWGEQYIKALKKTKYEYGTLKNDKYVSSKIPVEMRRPELSFAHHQVVASMNKALQEQILDEAIEKNLSSKQLRKFAKQYQPDGNKLSRRRDLTVEVLANATKFMRTLDQFDYTSLSDEQRKEFLSKMKLVVNRIIQYFKKFGLVQLKKPVIREPAADTTDIQEAVMQIINEWGKTQRRPITQMKIVADMDKRGINQPSVVNAIKSLIKKGYIRKGVSISNKVCYVQLRSI